MGRRSEPQDHRNIPDIMPWILAQFRRPNQPDQIDDPLEVRRPALREVTAQMLSRHPDRLGEIARPDWATSVRQHRTPRSDLHGCVESEA